jgi:hypothetical protein
MKFAVFDVLVAVEIGDPVAVGSDRDAVELGQDWSGPSSTASRVCPMKAATSEPTNISPSPMPTTKGVDRRAATMVPGSSALANTTVKWPSRRRSTASTEAVKSPAVWPW